MLLSVLVTAGYANVSAQAKSYKLVTSDTELEAGAKYILVGKNESAFYAMGWQDSSNRKAVLMSENSGVIEAVPASDAADKTNLYEITFGGVSGAWTFFDAANNTYLRPKIGKNNALVGETTPENWTVSIAPTGVATIKCTGSYDRNVLRFNKATASNLLFACYASGQTDVYLYKEITSANQVKIPTFSVEVGTYYNPINVAITSETEGAAIYYTTDETEPTNASTLYTGEITLSATTTLKAIAYKDGMDPSYVASVTYTIPEITDITDIAALRASATGNSVYRLTGEAVLTLQSNTSSGNPKYIQDATAAILVRDADEVVTTTGYELGKSFQNILGKLSDYNGMLQFTPVVDLGAQIPATITITPQEVTLEELVNHPGELVTVENLEIAGTGNFYAGTSYNLNGATNPVLRTQYSDLDYIGTPIPSLPQTITGVVLTYYTTVQLVPRSAADIVEYVSTDPVIIATPESITGLTAVVNDMSEVASITVNALNMTEDITITLSDENNFMLDVNSLTPTDGKITDGVVDFVYTPQTLGTHTATITLTGTGVSATVQVSGTSVLGVPVATAATGVASDGFTANWNALAGATEYELFVYTKTELPETEVLNAPFDDVTGTGGNSGGWSGNIASGGLSTYGDWSLTNIYKGDGCIKFGTGSKQGTAVTPALATLNGDATLTFRAGAWKGDNTTLLLEITDGGALDQSSVEMVRESFTSYAVKIFGGTPSTKITFKAQSASNSRLFLDDVKIVAGGTVHIPITGSPFAVTETSKAISGLEYNTTYYYAVKGKAGDAVSDESNEISVTTDKPLNISDEEAAGGIDIRIVNGNIVVNTDQELPVSVYNMSGRLVASGKVVANELVVPLTTRGVYVVKIGEKAVKVVF
ncbi:MAG: chitobiase/beta-hexosaminidase C-terminal domain-containing protein [Dysgonomonas sp.]